MCEEDVHHRQARLTRRQFGAASAGTAASLALAGCASLLLTDAGLAESRERIATPSGMMDALFVRPARGRHPAILVWPDIASLRAAFGAMARRIAAAGYAVLVINPFYRDQPAPQFASFADFRERDGFLLVGPWRDKLTRPAVSRDAEAAIAWLDRRPSVDLRRGVGVEGYCMGGPLAVWSAAAVPSRVGAVASFHGGGLVREGADSPHALLGAARAHYLFAIGQDDHARDPAVRPALEAAAAAAGREAEVEVYAADHGWTVPDSPSYHAAEADRAFARKLALYAGL